MELVRATTRLLTVWLVVALAAPTLAAPTPDGLRRATSAPIALFFEHLAHEPCLVDAQEVEHDEPTSFRDAAALVDAPVQVFARTPVHLRGPDDHAPARARARGPPRSA